MNRHRLLSTVLSEILMHAQRNGIAPSLHPLDDYDRLVHELCSSQLIEWCYIFNLAKFQFTLKPVRGIERYALHDFIMTRNDNHSDDISLMIERDVWKGESTIYVSLDLPFDKYLPFVSELLDSEGKFRISYISNDIENIIMKKEMMMDADEWHRLLAEYNGQRNVEIVDVE